MPSRKPYRIVHLTDLHLTETDDDERSEPKFFGKLTGMNRSFRQLLFTRTLQSADLVLVTGDVSDRGKPEEWRVFRSAIHRAGLKDRCLVVPGNHDVCHLGWPRIADRGDRHGEDYAKMKRGLHIAQQRWTFPWVVQVDPRVAIIGLESSNPGNLSAVNNAVGELGFRQLEALARLLKKHRDVPVKIVAMHHSPNIPTAETRRRRELPESKWVDRWGMEVPSWERRALRLLCLTHGVRLIAHGHLHLAEDRYVNGVRIIGGPATTEPLPGSEPRQVQFWQYTVRGGGGRLEPELMTVAVE